MSTRARFTFPSVAAIAASSLIIDYLYIYFIIMKIQSPIKSRNSLIIVRISLPWCQKFAWPAPCCRKIDNCWSCTFSHYLTFKLLLILNSEGFLPCQRCTEKYYVLVESKYQRAFLDNPIVVPINLN